MAFRDLWEALNLTLFVFLILLSPFFAYSDTFSLFFFLERSSPTTISLMAFAVHPLGMEEINDKRRLLDAFLYSQRFLMRF